MKDRRERLEEACFCLGSISLGREHTEDELIEALIRQAHVHKDGWLEAEKEFAALIGRKPTDFYSMKNIRDAIAAALASARAEGMREAAEIVIKTMRSWNEDNWKNQANTVANNILSAIGERQ